MTRIAARPTRRTTQCRLERLESRQLLSTSPIDPTFAPREQGVAFATYAADVAVRDDGKVLVAESRQVGDVRRMAVTRYNADGSLDATFGAGGRAYADFGGAFASVEGMDVTPDGHIVLAGAAGGDYAVARFNADGTPDASFGGDGTVTVNLGGTREYLLDVRVDAAGRVVAAGHDAADKLHLFRFTAAGTADASFGGGDGELQTTVTAPGFRHVGAVLTLPDNRIVLAGSGRVQRFAVDGSLETTFAPGPFGVLYDLALQPDGKVIAGGITSDFSLARFTTDGALDPTFGIGGIVTTKIGGGNENVVGLALQPDGRIVATGDAWATDNYGYEFYTARYLANGTLDGSFDGDGIVRTDVRFQSTDFPAAVAVAPGGKIVVAGDVNDLYADVQTSAAVRYNPDGSLDTTFGGTAKVLGTFDGGYRRTISAMQRQGDGKVVVAGTRQVGFNYDFFVARYLADGRHDPSFGDGGVAVTDFGGRYDSADALLIQPDGKILVGGQSDGPTVNNVPDDRFALARFTAAGRLDPTFDGDGRVLTEMGASYDEGIRDLDLYAGGRIVAVGYGGVARYNPNGSPDPSFATDGTLNQPGLWGIAGAVSGDKIVYASNGDVRRVNADGSSDLTFHFTPLPAPPSPLNDPEEGEPYTVYNDMALTPDGKILVGGTYHPYDYDDEMTAFAVQRYLPTGAPDTSFGTGGQTISDFDEFFGEQVGALAVAPGGKPVLVGWGAFNGRGADPIVARYTADGRPDSTFGYDRMAFTDEASYTTASAVAIEPDGDVLVATNRSAIGNGTTVDVAKVLRFYGTARAGANLDRSLKTVFVTGTASNDSILIDATGGRLTVTVNGLRQSFSNRTYGQVYVYGGAGDDVITVRGTVGAKLYGGDGNDRLTGGPASESLYGGAGNDTLDGGLGADDLSGGDGTDTVDYGTRTASVFVIASRYRNDGEVNERDAVYSDVEIVRGGSGNDVIQGYKAAYGNGGDDTLMGGDFPSALWGGDGNDYLVSVSGAYADYFRGGDGIDTVSYDNRNTGVTATIDGLANDGAPGEGDNVYADVENLVGGGGDDKLTGSAADNTLDGGGGSDELHGGAGNDTVTYAGRSDTVFVSIDGVANDGTPARNSLPAERDNVNTDIENVIGGDGNDSIMGSDADNRIDGGAGNDGINGGNGNDTIQGGPGDDYLDGGGDDDTIDGGTGFDSLDGSQGNDTVSFSSLATAVTVHLLTFEYNDSGQFYKYGTADTSGTPQETFSDFENVTGGAGDDLIYGDWRDNVLSGGPGNDSIYGGAGIDTLAGGDGADVFRGEDDVDVFLDAPGTDTDDLRGSARLDDQGLLRVFGTDGPDTISLLLVGDMIVLTGSVGPNGRTTYPAAAVKSVWIDGNAGDDRVTIGNADGTSMPQVKAHLAGGPGNDTLIAGGGDDELWGGLGDDVLDGGLGSDTVWGGGGSDTADYSRRTTGAFVHLAGALRDYRINPLFGSGGATTWGGGVQGENDQIRYDVLTARGGSGQDELSGGQDTVLYGGPGGDLLSMPASLDGITNITLDGGPGNDRFDTDDFAGGTMLGGEGDDYFKLDWEADTLVVDGGPGSDTVEAARHWGDPFVFDAAGKNVEVIYGSDIGDVITGTDAAETIDGRGGDDTIRGNGGDDVLAGGDGNDDLRGGDGNDTLTGGAGRDQLRGNAGDDTLFADGDGEVDFLDGGSGTDKARKDKADFAQYVEQFLA